MATEILGSGEFLWKLGEEPIWRSKFWDLVGFYGSW